MRAVILNGALTGDEQLVPIEQSIDTALSIRGWTVDRIHLCDLTIVYCQGCFGCWVKTPGVCATKDQANVVTRALCGSDLLVVLSPITFGGYSSELKKALDRSIGIISPMFKRLHGEVHHKPRYARYPALLAIGVAVDDDAEEERIFRRLTARNALNFHAPTEVTAIIHRTDAAEQMRRVIGSAVAEATKGKREIAS